MRIVYTIYLKYEEIDKMSLDDWLSLVETLDLKYKDVEVVLI